MLSKDIRVHGCILKASWTSESYTHKLQWVLFFIVDYGPCGFSLFNTFFIICSSYVSAFFTYGSMDPTYFVKFFPCWLSVYGKPHHLACLLILGLFTHNILLILHFACSAILFTHILRDQTKHTKNVLLRSSFRQEVLNFFSRAPLALVIDTRA